jgi:hypothetical protein
MNHFKYIINTSTATLLLFLCITIYSCKKDKCKNIVCQHEGVCNNGKCQCPQGYEGNNCEFYAISNLTKTWTVTDSVVEQPTGSVQYQNYSYQCTINPLMASSISIQNNIASILNFGSPFFINSIKASYSANTISIARQAPDADFYYISGTGTIASNEINFVYLVETSFGNYKVSSHWK